MKSYNKKKEFTHFVSLPFIRKNQRQTVGLIQKDILNDIVKVINIKQVKQNSNLLMHLTLSMLNLHDNEAILEATHIFQQCKQLFQDQLRYTTLTLSKLGYFTRVNYDTNIQQVNVIYMQVQNDKQLQKVNRMTGIIIKMMMQRKIIKIEDLKTMHISYSHQTKTYYNKNTHLTLFYLSDVTHNEAFRQAFDRIKNKVAPIKLDCDFLDISTRFHFDSSKFYTPLTRIVLESTS